MKFKDDQPVWYIDGREIKEGRISHIKEYANKMRGDNVWQINKHYSIAFVPEPHIFVLKSEAIQALISILHNAILKLAAEVKEVQIQETQQGVY